MAIAICCDKFHELFCPSFSGQLKCMCRQTCCKLGLSSHTRRALPLLFGIMATEKSLQKLIVQVHVHCELRPSAVLRFAVHATRLLHFACTSRNSRSSLWHLKFVFSPSYIQRRHRTLHIALHTSHFTNCARVSLRIDVPQFALPSTSRSCLSLNAVARQTQSIRLVLANCECENENEPLSSAVFRENAIKEVVGDTGY